MHLSDFLIKEYCVRHFIEQNDVNKRHFIEQNDVNKRHLMIFMHLSDFLINEVLCVTPDPLVILSIVGDAITRSHN